MVEVPSNGISQDTLSRRSHHSALRRPDARQRRWEARTCPLTRARPSSSVVRPSGVATGAAPPTFSRLFSEFVPGNSPGSGTRLSAAPGATPVFANPPEPWYYPGSGCRGKLSSFSRFQASTLKVQRTLMFSQGFFTSQLEKAVGWARKYSLFQYPFVTACCGMEYMATASSHYDIDRFGAGFPRFSPRQADVLFVVGTINHKMAPVLKRFTTRCASPNGWSLLAFALAPAVFTTTTPPSRASIPSSRSTFTFQAARRVPKPF